MRVLLADDNEAMRRGLASLLSREIDIEVVGEARDGEEAVRMAAEIEPDVVVMDVAMPVMGGVEATRGVKALKNPPHVIGLSMFSDAVLIRRMLDAGADDYVVKSGDPRTLLLAIRATGN